DQGPNGDFPFPLLVAAVDFPVQMEVGCDLILFFVTVNAQVFNSRKVHTATPQGNATILSVSAGVLPPYSGNFEKRNPPTCEAGKGLTGRVRGPPAGQCRGGTAGSANGPPGGGFGSSR